MDSFDSSNRDIYPAFVLQLTLLFSNNSRRYPNIISKILAAGSYLLGNALNWFDPNCNKSTGAVSWESYDDFWEAFKAAYDNPDKKATAEYKLLHLRQGNKTASAYYSEFTTYAAILNLDDATKISFFRRGVNEELSLALSFQIDPPTEFALFARMCITLDNQVKMRKNRKPIPASIPAYSPAPPPVSELPVPPANGPSVTPRVHAPESAPGGDSMDVSAVSHNRGPLSEAEKQYRRENGLCNYCGTAGHFANACPYKQRNFA